MLCLKHERLICKTVILLKDTGNCSLDPAKYMRLHHAVVTTRPFGKQDSDSL